MLGHDAVAADAAHRVDGSTPALTGGVCERTPQVRDALVAQAQGRDAAVTDCSKVTETHLAAVRLLNLEDPGMTALKAGDFEGLSRGGDAHPAGQRADRAAGGDIRRSGRNRDGVWG